MDKNNVEKLKTWEYEHPSNIYKKGDLVAIENGFTHIFPFYAISEKANVIVENVVLCSRLTKWSSYFCDGHPSEYISCEGLRFATNEEIRIYNLTKAGFKKESKRCEIIHCKKYNDCKIVKEL